MAILALLSCVFTVGAPHAPVHYSTISRLRDGIIPVVLGVNPTTASPAANVQFTVTLSGEATGDEIYNVSSTSGAFSSIPTQIQPEEGATQIVFPATVSSSGNGNINVSISGNGGKCSVAMMVVVQQKGASAKK